jgi:AcrR family transcriptional regulator
MTHTPVITDTAADAPARRKLLTRDERRAAIIHSAAQAFARTGFAATSMDEVARASGVTKLILYRNFESKEALYRAVLEAVSARLAEIYLGEFESPARRPAGARALLTAAREEPDGFVLLWRHAAREVPFAPYAHEFREVVVGMTRDLIAPRFGDDPTLLGWAADALVAWNVEAVLSWLERGDPARDEAFLALASRTVRSMMRTWSED